MGKLLLGVVVGVLLCKPYLAEAGWVVVSTFVQSL
jgi:hypothetical protein